MPKRMFVVTIGRWAYSRQTMRRMRRNLCVVAVLAAVAGCASSVKPPTENGGMYRRQNEGYSLLYKLMSDESDVNKILYFKHTDEAVGALVKEIATVCQSARKQMDDFPKSDNRIEYDVPDLPKIEQRGRDLQAHDDTMALLGSSGTAFETRLIFTQAQAMDYAVQISKGLLENEDNPIRKTFLSELAKKCADLHDRAMSFLTVKSQ